MTATDREIHGLARDFIHTFAHGNAHEFRGIRDRLTQALDEAHKDGLLLTAILVAAFEEAPFMTRRGRV